MLFFVVWLFLKILRRRIIPRIFISIQGIKQFLIIILHFPSQLPLQLINLLISSPFLFHRSFRLHLYLRNLFLEQVALIVDLVPHFLKLLSEHLDFLVLLSFLRVSLPFLFEKFFRYISVKSLLYVGRVRTYSV